MEEAGLTFHNRLGIKVQAQIFVDRELISTTLVEPGATRILPAPSACYDVYLKNGATGWEIARKLDTESISLTLAVHDGRYTLR